MLKKFSLVIIQLLLLTSIFAQKKPFTIEDLYKVKNVSTAAVSNDANHILFSTISYDLPKSSSSTDIYICDTNGNNLRQLTNNDAADFHPIWEKEGKGFYFVSYRTGSAQLFHLSLDGGEAEQITNFLSRRK